MLPPHFMVPLVINKIFKNDIIGNTQVYIRPCAHAPNWFYEFE